jgi:hypothetical protein
MPLLAWRQWCEWLRKNIAPEVELSDEAKQEILREERF